MRLPAVVVAGLAGALLTASARGASPTAATDHPVAELSGRVAITVSIISYPGVPEKSACRFLFRAVNESGRTVGLSTLLHTFDTYKTDLNSWLVPTGDMAPGQAVERLYTCKTASYVQIDDKSGQGWPNTCQVNGQTVTPCPVAVDVASNLTILK